ncbi:unnamed protein product [Sympodiomycopsis kandeliae]
MRLSLSSLMAGLPFLTAAAATAFTPEKLITAPRTASEFVLSPDQKHLTVGLSHAHYDGTPTKKQVRVLQMPHSQAFSELSKTRPNGNLVNTLQDISFAAWLDDYTLIYVNGSDLYASDLDSKHKSYKLAYLPTTISDDSLKVVSAPHGQKRLVFAAEVYEDGHLESVSKIETKDHEEEWSRVKAYDGDNGALYRHWDQWNKPGKRSQLFTSLLHKKGSSWSFVEKDNFYNLIKGTKFNTPIPPFGGNDDWDVNEHGVILNTKAVDLPEAWHTRTDVYHVSFHDGKITKLSRQDPHGAISSPVFSPDGETIAWLQMTIDGFESDKRVVQVFDVQSGEQKALLTKWDRSPSGLSFSPKGDKLYLVTEDHQKDKVYVVDVDKSERVAEPEEFITLESGSVQSIRPLTHHDDGGEYTLLSSSSLRHPSEIFLWSPDSKSSYPLTWFSGDADTSSLTDVEWGSAPKEFSYPSPDKADEKRWGWIHYPRGYGSDSKKKWPVAVLIHGGPEGAWTDSWSTRWNPEVFAGAGYLVVTLNPVGSTGFGQKYQEGVLNNWGGEPYRDILAGVHHILSRESSHIDRSKIAGLGASYGGYMINWLQGHNDDSLFRTLVCHDGVFSTFSTFYSTEEHWFPEHEFGFGVPWNLTSRAVYSRWSPENHVSNWKTPQLIIHGDKDFRLTPDQGISVFNTLRRRGVDTRLVYFENEGHWVLDSKSSLRWHREILSWLDKYIGEGSHRNESVDSSQEASGRDRVQFGQQHQQTVFQV